MIGVLFRDDSCHHTSSDSAITETIVRYTISRLLNQSLLLPSSRTYCSEPTPMTSSTMPHQSTAPLRRTWLGESCRNVTTRNAEMTPIGRLMKKHQCQLALS